MDSKPEDNKALLKLHYGVSFNNDSDSESVVSLASSHSIFEKYRPKPYSYEEIKSRLTVVEAGPLSAKPVDNVKQLPNLNKTSVVSKNNKIRNLMNPKYCHLCKAELQTPQHAQDHYGGKRHQVSLRLRLETYTNSNDQPNDVDNNTNRNISQNHSSSDKSLDNTRTNKEVNEILETKLKSLTQPFYCHLCQADLQTSHNTMSHYNSKRHTDMCDTWYGIEKHKMLENQKNEILSFKNGTINSSSIITKEDIQNKLVQGTTEQKLNKLLQPDYCYICKADLQQGMNQMSHYSSKRHTNLLKLWYERENNDKDKNVDHLSTTSQENLNKMIITYHDDLTKNFQEDPKEDLFELLTDESCTVCGKFFVDINSANSHYISNDHGKNVKLWYDMMTCNRQADIIKSKEFYSSQSSLESVLTTLTTLYCHLCKSTFYTKETIDEHVCSFVHQEQLKLVLILIKKGIPLQDYWLELFKKMVNTKRCELCHKNLSTNEMAISHSNSEYHRNEVKYWIHQHKVYASKNAPEIIDRKVCYCVICDKDLDGTTKTTLHYIGHSHKKHLTTYCEACKLQTGTTKDYEAHIKSSSHIKQMSTLKLCEDQQKTRVSINSNIPNKNAQNVTKNKDAKIEPNAQTALKSQNKLLIALNTQAFNLDHEVSKELKKLQDTIYYSKQIPLEVALKYLQKFNQELDEIKKSCQPTSHTELLDKKTNFTEEENAHLEVKDLEMNPNNVNKNKKHVLEQPEIKDQMKNNKEVTTAYNLNDSKKLLKDCATIQNVAKKEYETDDPIKDFNEQIPAKVLKDKFELYTNKNSDISKIINDNLDPCCSKDVGVQNRKLPNIVEEKEENRYATSDNNSGKSSNTISSLNNKISRELTFKSKEILCDVVDENDLENNVLTELNKFIDSVSDGVLERSVIITCLKHFNKELEDYLKTDSKGNGKVKRTEEWLTNNIPLVNISDKQTGEFDKFCEKEPAHTTKGKVDNKKANDHFQASCEKLNHHNAIEFRNLVNQIPMEIDNLDGEDKLSEKKIFNLQQQNQAETQKVEKDNFLEIMKYEEENFKIYYDDENNENFLEFRELYLNSSIENSLMYKRNQITNEKNVKTMQTASSWLLYEQEVSRSYYDDQNLKKYMEFQNVYLNDSLETNLDRSRKACEFNVPTSIKLELVDRELKNPMSTDDLESKLPLKKKRKRNRKAKTNKEYVSEEQLESVSSSNVLGSLLSHEEP